MQAMPVGNEPARKKETPQQRMGAVATAAREALGMSQRAVAQAVWDELDEHERFDQQPTQGLCSNWERGARTRMEPHHVFAWEKVLGLAPGVLSRECGYMPPDAAASSVERAVLDDRRFTKGQKEALLAVIAQFRSVR